MCSCEDRYVALWTTPLGMIYAATVDKEDFLSYALHSQDGLATTTL